MPIDIYIFFLNEMKSIILYTKYYLNYLQSILQRLLYKNL